MKNKHQTILIKSYLLFIALCIWLFVFLFQNSAIAQQQNIRFKHLTIDDGLSQSWIHSIYQDKYGFIWIGTDDGLNRYDGYDFHIYKNDTRNEYSLNSSAILNMFEDSNGNLWIGTREGLNFYDRKNDRFIRRSSIIQQAVRSIAEDKDKNLWIGTSINLYRLNLENDSLYTYTADSPEQNGNSLSNNDVRAIFIDDRNNIWISTAYGLNLYDKATNSFIKYYHDNNDPGSLSNNDIRTLLMDKSGRLWIGTPTGLDLFTNAQDRPLRGIFEHYQNNSKDQNSISQGAILSLFEDDKHNLWIGIENGGLDLFNLNTYKKGVNSFTHFKNDPNSSTSLSNNSIYSLFQDKQKNIWVGTFGNGINIISAVGGKFIHFLSEPGNKNSLINNQVNTFLEDKNFLWIGTEGGLERYNKTDGSFKHFVHDPLDRRSIGSNAVWALCKDKRGNLWVGTWGGGLNRFDYTTETFEHYYNDPQDTNSIGASNIFSILEDKSGNLWIGTMGGGLNLFDTKKGIFTRYDNANSGLYTNYVASIVEADNGDLWLGNEASLERFNIKTKRIEHFLHSADDSTSISSNYVISILEDSKGNIWVGTNTGLNLFNKSTEGFTCYRIENGLPDNSINSILEDYHGNLWLGTNRGLVKFIDAINIPAKPKFKNYTFEDGLQSNGFGKRSCLKGADGIMYFGGTNGFNVFDPNTITDNTYIPPIVINSFQIFNKPVLIGERGLKKETGTDESLILSYKQSVFSFGFAALNYNSSSKNRYAYKMEGFDEEWNYVGTKRAATYTNLDPGEYTFKVKGSNNDGVWNEEGASIHIIITPPFWQTLWFSITIAMVLLGILYWMYKRWVRSREFAEKMKMEEAIAKERNLLRTLIDNHPDLIFVKDRECKKIISNPVDLRYMGAQSEKEVIGKTDFDFYPAEEAAMYHASDQEVIQSGIPIINQESYILDKQGKKINVLYFKIPLRDEQGQIIGLVGGAHDITELKRIQEALQQERKILRTLIDNIPDAIYIKDEQCRKVVANVADVRNTGRQSEREIIGKNDFELFPKELAEGFYADDQRVIQTGQPVMNREEYVIDENGERRWLVTSKLPLRNEEKKIIGLVGIGRDVTEKKRIEAALLEREELYRSLISASPDAICVTNLHGSIMYVSSKALEMFGIAKMDGIVNRNIFEWIAPELHQKAQASMQQTLNQGHSRGQEFTLVRKDGSQFIGEINASVFRNADGEPSGIILVTRDITTRKLAEEALSQKTALLEAQLNSSIDGVLVVDDQGKKILQNQRTVELWKIPQEIADNPDDQMQVNHVMNLTKDPDQFVRQVKYLYEHHNESSRGEIELKDGTILDRYSAPVIGKDGRHYGRIWSFRDITERKRVEEEREILIRELQNALAEVKVLSGLVPICSNCKKIRDDSGFWNQLESYIQKHSQAKFSHGICPDCMAQLYPDISVKKDKNDPK